MKAEHNSALHRELAAVRRPQHRSAELFMEFEGFELVVRGDYQPAERQTFDCPGSAEDFDITAVYLPDSAIDIADLFDARALSIAALEEIRRQEENRLADAAEAAPNWRNAA